MSEPRKTGKELPPLDDSWTHMTDSTAERLNGWRAPARSLVRARMISPPRMLTRKPN